MDKFTKKLLLINICSIVLAFGVIELLSYIKLHKVYGNIIKTSNEIHKKLNDGYKMSLSYKKIHPFNYADYKNGLKVNKGNSKKLPAIFFGCSYLEGYGLHNNQTLPYKITQQTGITSYNRGVGANGPQQMLYELSQESFYQEIPDTQLLVYLFMEDHYERMNRSIPNIFSTVIQPKYVIKNDALTEVKQPPAIFYSFFTSRVRDEGLFKKHKIINEENFELFFEILKKSYNLAKTKYPNAKFIILSYENNENPIFEDDQIKELEKTGFIVLNAEKLVNHSLFNEQYTISDKTHPNEKAWDEIASKLIKILSLH